MSYQRYQPSRSASPKYIIGGIVLLIVIAGLAAFLWSRSGNRGTIEKLPAAKNVVHGPALLSYPSPYIAFQYKSTYQLVKQTPSGTSLEMSLLSADTSYEKHLTVAIFPLDATNLDMFSPYETRKVQPNLYARTDTTVDGSPATIFTKNDATETTVVLLHKGKAATLSFTTASSYDNLPAEVSALLQTFRWKQ